MPLEGLQDGSSVTRSSVLSIYPAAAKEQVHKKFEDVTSQTLVSQLKHFSCVCSTHGQICMLIQIGSNYFVPTNRRNDSIQPNTQSAPQPELWGGLVAVLATPSCNLINSMNLSW